MAKWLAINMAMWQLNHMTTSMYPNEFSAMKIRSAIADLRKIRSGGEVSNVFFQVACVGPEHVSEEEVEESFRVAWKTRWTMRAAS
jgi:hypothetical protein